MSRGQVWACFVAFAAIGIIVLGSYQLATKEVLSSGPPQTSANATLYGWITIGLGVGIGLAAIIMWRKAPKEDEY